MPESQRPHRQMIDLPPCLKDRGPLRVVFINTSMPVGGAETLLMNLMRGIDRDRFIPEFCCLKEFGPVGEELAKEFTGVEGLTKHKYDATVLPRLMRWFRSRRVDAVVTVGAGDKMFWGRLAAYLTKTPVILSALHSTGWPDTIGRLNRLLTPITDGFIGVAPQHGRYLAEQEGFPEEKVFVIPNGVDATRFAPRPSDRQIIRNELGLPPDLPVCGVVAALRPEKNLGLLIRAFAKASEHHKAALVIAGDGPEKNQLADLTRQLGIGDRVHLLGTRRDIPQLLNSLDLFALSSKMEANPVSILEALATGVPVVAPRVGSIPDTVRDGMTGLLAKPSDEADLTAHLTMLLSDAPLRRQMGEAGRDDILASWTLEHMVDGYMDLITSIYIRKTGGSQHEEQSRPLHDRSQRDAVEVV